MQCNIDARGKRLRLLSGILTLTLAAILAVLLLVGLVWPAWVWVVVIAAAVGGAFQVFEARAGWCALRAMGIRTKV